MSFKKVRNAHKTENTEDYLELIAELGGYVGLFLGISVFDINLIVSKVLSYRK